MSMTTRRQRPIPVDPGRGLHRPLGLYDYVIAESSYWGQWQVINQQSILDHCLFWMERAGWIDNFRAAVQGELPAQRRGREFTDSDVYKLLEALVWESARSQDPRRESQIEGLVQTISAAQEGDGYLNTNFGRPGQAARYSDLEWGHELYNYGHLLQAATARVRTFGEDTLVALGRRVADHICDTFGENGIRSVCGHPEIEMALIEFGRATSTPRYIDQAELFLERRGHHTLREIEFGREYFQDDTPIRQAGVLRGHAVRALYLSCAAVDLAVERGDDDLLATIEGQWERTVSRRTYLTGGMGSHHQDEAFGGDFELPSDRAYCESCAGVGAFMWSWRLLLATGKARYADLMERTLHNIIATSPGRNGTSFFYSNTLHQRTLGETPDPNNPSPRASSDQRAPWFDVSCCPPNVARTLSSLSTYLITTADDTVAIQLYTAGDVDAEIPAGRVSFRVETNYPFEGSIKITVLAAPASGWCLALRIPSWSVHYEARIDGAAQPGLIHNQYLMIDNLKAGQSVQLDLDDAPRFTFPDNRIDAIRGTVAIERGPLVYCLESALLPPGVAIDEITIDTSFPPQKAGQGVVVHASATPSPAESWPYSAAQRQVRGTEALLVTLSPYAEWGESGPSTMRVWTCAAAVSI
jgi:DUF1680 family protein